MHAACLLRLPSPLQLLPLCLMAAVHPTSSHARARGMQAAAAAAAVGPAAAARHILLCRTLLTYSEPVSPHLAAAREGRVVHDDRLIARTARALASFSESASASAGPRGPALCVVETAGGVASPGPSGTLQACLCDVCVHRLHSACAAPVFQQACACNPCSPCT